jgi:hypothetical protein
MLWSTNDYATQYYKFTEYVEGNWKPMHIIKYYTCKKNIIKY